MLKLDISADCGNAPKMQLIKDLNIAFAKGDIETVTGFFADHIIWEMIGDRTLEGKDKVIAYLHEMADMKATGLVLHQVITHGKDAAARGVLMFENISIAFADFYEFTSAGSGQIKRITSYAREI